MLDSAVTTEIRKSAVLLARRYLEYPSFSLDHVALSCALPVQDPAIALVSATLEYVIDNREKLRISGSITTVAFHRRACQLVACLLEDGWRP